MMKLSLAVLVLCVAACTADTSYKVNINNTYVEFMTKSLMASKQSDISKDENKLTVMFADLQQVKADNAPIAGLNNTLPAAMFTFEDETDETSGDITFKRRVGNASVFEGTFKVYIELFTKGGNITMDGETTTVMEGGVRVVVEMAAMTFAEDAATLKLMLNIKGPATPAMLTPAGTDGVAYNLGEGGAVRLSKKVMIITQGASYQSVTPMMSGNDFSFSLPKGSSVKYSFFLQLSKAKMGGGDDPSAAAAVTPLLVTWVVAAACKLLF
ncbi:uncharacterized protein LOC124113372 [Haliotis rufescens]|uniref:uncharacterized protein LOC124113372 n=1 Tax=Haliotis rufescens TaxID=6454 RepID=UPI00201EB383|nr:uncharacterized protein LOC124113372 [Haliotis rufescens]